MLISGAGSKVVAGGSVLMSDSDLEVTAGGLLQQDQVPTSFGIFGADFSDVLVSGAGSKIVAAGIVYFVESGLSVTAGGQFEQTAPVSAFGSFLVNSSDLLVTGAGSKILAQGSTLIAGSTDDASVRILDGGVFDTRDGALVVGDVGVSTSVLVSGAGSLWTIGKDLQLGCPCGPATLSIADRGVVHAAGAIVIGAGSTLNLGLGGLAGRVLAPEIVNDGTITANFTDSLDIATRITGTGSLVKSGTGTLVLTGDNSYSGGTSVSGGTLSLRSDHAAGTGAITTLGSVIDYGDDVSIANPIVVNSDHTQLQVLSGVAEQAGDISELGGSRRLEKTGAGALLLSGNNSYSGGTLLSAGTLGLGSDLAAGTGTITARGSVIDYARRGRHRQSDHHRLRSARAAGARRVGTPARRDFRDATARARSTRPATARCSCSAPATTRARPTSWQANWSAARRRPWPRPRISRSLPVRGCASPPASAQSADRLAGRRRRSDRRRRHDARHWRQRHRHDIRGCDLRPWRHRQEWRRRTVPDRQQHLFRRHRGQCRPAVGRRLDRQFRGDGG